MGFADTINTKVDAAITAAESGDHTTAVKYLRSALMAMNAMPDARKGNHELKWDRESLQRLLEHEEKLAASQSGMAKNLLRF